MNDNERDEWRLQSLSTSRTLSLTSVSRIRIRAPLQGGLSTSLNLQALAAKAKMAANRMIGRTKMLLPTLTQQPEEKEGLRCARGGPSSG